MEITMFDSKGRFQKGHGLIDITGQKFNRLTAIKPVGYTNNNGSKWLFRCDCGNECIKDSSAVRRGVCKSCGCLNQELRLARHTHGMHKTKLYSAWMHMKQRCLNPNCKSYKHYGGRGITVCPEWLSNFESFRDWALANGYAEDLTLDRIDNDGNYEPSNCRWVSMKVQESNKRNNHYVTYKGEKITLSECARRLGLTPNQFRYRHIVKGLSIDEISQDCGVMCYLTLEELKE